MDPLGIGTHPQDETSNRLVVACENLHIPVWGHIVDLSERQIQIGRARASWRGVWPVGSPRMSSSSTPDMLARPLQGDCLSILFLGDFCLQNRDDVTVLDTQAFSTFVYLYIYLWYSSDASLWRLGRLWTRCKCLRNTTLHIKIRERRNKCAKIKTSKRGKRWKCV